LFEELVLGEEQSWQDCFDTGTVRRLWAEGRRGEGTNQHHDIIDRVIWRAFFEDHLARLEG